MFLDSKNNMFSFNFSPDFIPEEINKQYYDYLNNVPGTMIYKPIDYLNYGIQSISLPGLTYSPVEQGRVFGEKDMYRTSIGSRELYSKQMTVNLKLMRGFVNYWMLYDIYKYYYSFQVKQLFIPDQRLEILDSFGNVFTYIHFNRILFTDISELELNFSTNNPSFNTFNISLLYNEMEVVRKFDVKY